ncbi:MAG TPA: dienelactone hydrolase family protein [Nocardioides sp.]|uniref:dienelactone hydrolase family protein n=1 Tax=Nocardioides sp. TaxID=35761 RepID=UPI002CB3AF79|nr:dienelactone hydrolase family protein [Nocardioides sp.]HTW15616.1 dienelactone hydrolase family protein [Nocardioides sp.]
MPGPSTTDVEYDDGRTRMIGSLTVPSAVSCATVLLLPDAYGVGEHAIGLAGRLAEHGHPVLVADLWGERRQPADQAEFGPMIGAMAADRTQWIGQVDAAHRALRAQPGLGTAPVVLLGYCFGGSSALEYVRTGGDVAGAVSVHGGLDILDHDWSAASSSPVLLCTGEDDPMATPEMRHDLTSAMDAAGNDWQLHVYSDTVHAFTSPMAKDSPRPDVVAYSARSTTRAWASTLAFLREVGSPTS